jgi:hypothetical protein
VPGAFHGGIPGPVWPAEDSHSPWTGCRGPRQQDNVSSNFLTQSYSGRPQ